VGQLVRFYDHNYKRNVTDIVTFCVRPLGYNLYNVRQGHAQLSLWLVLHRKRIKKEELDILLVLGNFMSFLTLQGAVVVMIVLKSSCSVGWLVGFMVFNAIFNNISVILWLSALLVEKSNET
jgi:hypothetical protein